MWGRWGLMVLTLLLFGRTSCAGEDRWYNFAEDADQRYYLDQKSMVSRPGNVFIFWVKSVAKEKDYYRRVYNLNDLAYLLTNVEMDCSDASYRVRQIIMCDRNRRELSKSVPVGADGGFEPIPPESSLELAQETVCVHARQNVEEDVEEEGEETLPPPVKQPPVPEPAPEVTAPDATTPDATPPALEAPEETTPAPAPPEKNPETAPAEPSIPPTAPGTEPDVSLQ